MMAPAIIFCLCFVAMFGWLVATGMATGIVRGVGWSIGRKDAPVFFWLCIGAYGLVFALGLLFSAVLVLASVQ